MFKSKKTVTMDQQTEIKQKCVVSCKSPKEKNKLPETPASLWPNSTPLSDLI